MPWRNITTDQITGRFSASERALFPQIQGVASKLSERLTDSIGKFIGAMTARHYPVKTDGSVPDQLRNHIMADAVWEWLKDVPAQLKQFRTDARKDAAKDAATAYDKICEGTYGAIEPPTVVSDKGVHWNSQPKIIGRMAPIPQPETQLQNTPTPIYANPNALPDLVPTEPTTPVPAAGTGNLVTSGSLNPNGQVTPQNIGDEYNQIVAGLLIKKWVNTDGTANGWT
jgi:hypothetical protein